MILRVLSETLSQECAEYFHRHLILFYFHTGLINKTLEATPKEDVKRGQV
jgi:hypothetical protein